LPLLEGVEGEGQANRISDFRTRQSRNRTEALSEVQRLQLLIQGALRDAQAFRGLLYIAILG